MPSSNLNDTDMIDMLVIDEAVLFVYALSTLAL
jgi:hypothetical protein